MTPFDPKQVFSTRVRDYLRHRPGYPPGVLATLVRDCGLTAAWRVADIGSGTGLLARLFLDLGCRVSGVEPNDDMRLASEHILAGYPGFTSLAGSAKQTGLADASVDLVAAGMAFHWFDGSAARREFRRILVRGGWVALAWQRMLTAPDPFMQAYTSLVLEFSPGWTETLRRDGAGSPLDLAGFFGGAHHQATFPFQHRLDREGLCGRTRSIAHLPPPGDPRHHLLFSRLGEIFDRHHTKGQVVLHYETELYYGRLT